MLGDDRWNGYADESIGQGKIQAEQGDIGILLRGQIAGHDRQNQKRDGVIDEGSDKIAAGYFA